MKYEVINRRKLTELIGRYNIHSITEISSNYGKSLAITIKSGSRIPYAFKQYGDRTRGMIIYVPLDKYTYHIPHYVALPEDQWDNIILLDKRALHDNNQIAGEFHKATITKKVTW